jgi:GT2 family glycosyltransferase
MLEDRSIAVQAEQVRGLNLWLSPAPVTAEQVMAGAPPPAAEPLRWSWAARPQATVEVVICVYNAVEETLACLRSLIGSTTIPHTVRLIDDGSAPQVTARIEAFIADKPWMRLVRNPENLGYTYSADRGVREAEADWVILLNSDTVVSPGWIEGMLEAAASDPGVAFVGPLSNAATFQSVPELYDAKSQFKINDLPAGWTPAQMAALVAATSEKAFPETPLLNGFCTLMKRDAFVELGGLNRAAFPAGYGEENDLCTRAVKAGYKLVVADQVYVYHVKSASFGSARRQELAKAGSRALKELHPDVDYAALTAGFRDTPALVRLRDTLRDRLALTN